MTDPTRDLPEPSERDPAFDAAWRAASSEGPPAALDSAILAAAHRAVGAGPRRPEVRAATRWERWWFPLAAAATIGAVTIGILQLAPQDHGTTPDGGAIVSDMPAGATMERRDVPTTKAAPEATAPAAAPKPSPAAAPAPAPAPVPAPSAATASAPPAPAAAPSVNAPAAAVGKLAAPTESAARADARNEARAPLLVADWIALIRKLRDDGMIREAEKELAAFRAAHPDHERLLPADLREWRPAEK